MEVCVSSRSFRTSSYVSFDSLCLLFTHLVHRSTDVLDAFFFFFFVYFFFFFVFFFFFFFSFFFFNDPATTEIYTLSLHDALPILTAADCSGQCRELHPAGRHVEKLAVDGHHPVAHGQIGRAHV